MTSHCKLLNVFCRRLRQLGRDDSGQDMIEYALLAAALVIIVAGFLPPQVVPAVSSIFSRIVVSLNAS
jgi:Flp pilus assembly pilin Flp